MKQAQRLLLFAAILLSIFLTAANSSWAGPLRIGYYGGTFDPPTLGHLGLVKRAIEQGHLDIMYVMPSITNSHKPNATPYSLRKQMVQMNFQDFPQVRLPDQEMEEAFRNERATGVLAIILKRHRNAKILRLTGDDVISRNFNQELREDPRFAQVGLIVGQRTGPNKSNAEDISQFDLGSRELIVFPDSADEGISSSQARQSLLENGYGSSKTKKFLGPRVLSFIENHWLYLSVKSCHSALVIGF